MDQSLAASEIIKQVIEHYAQFQPSHGKIRLETIFDDHQGRYALMQTGWDRDRRIRGNLIYVVLEQEMIRIEYDGMEHGIFYDLVKKGVSPERIVLAYLPDCPTGSRLDFDRSISSKQSAIA